MTTYRIAKGVLRAELEGEAVLMNPETGQYHLLNATGVEVLDSIERDGRVTDVIPLLVRQSGLSESSIATEVQSFVQSLLDRRLLDLES